MDTQSRARIRELRDRQAARHAELQERMTMALFNSDVSENLRWVIQTLIDHMPRDDKD
jgi:hypothetical protein